MRGDWVNQEERGSPFALRLILWIAENLGRDFARIILYPITLYFLLMAKPQRTASRQYLSRIFGRRATLSDVARHIHCFASTILDRVFLLADRSSEFDIQRNNPEEVYRLVDQGQGCLLLGAHLGSFEVLRAPALNELKLPLKILMYQNHNEQISKIFMGLNPEIAQSILPLGQTDTMLKVADAVAEGKAVAMLGDRAIGSEKSVNCRFLGEMAQFPAGSMLLASYIHVAREYLQDLGGNKNAENAENAEAQRNKVKSLRLGINFFGVLYPNLPITVVAPSSSLTSLDAQGPSSSKASRKFFI